MAKAQQGKVYAQIINARVHWLFTSADLPEWNESQIVAIDVTGKSVSVGDTYNEADGSFISGAITVDQIKSRQWDAIKAERDRRKAGGVKVGAKWFHSDDGSRIQQLGLLMMGASIPAGLQWKTMDGSFITMTQALTGNVFAAAVASDQAVFAAAETHRVAMEASADPASYDYSGGWPKIYGE